MTSVHLSQSRSRPGAFLLDRFLIVTGVVASLTYILADIVCGLRYPGYSFTDQVISELSAIGAPTAALWAPFMTAFGIFFALFAIGVLRTARNNAKLRLTGWLLAVFVFSGPLWSIVPMHRRGVAFNASDIGHITLGAISVVLMGAVVFSASRALGPRFRRISLFTLAVVLPAGAASFLYVGPMMHGQATPAVGSLERLSIHGFFVWSAIFALTLVRWGEGDSAAARTSRPRA